MRVYLVGFGGVPVDGAGENGFSAMVVEKSLLLIRKMRLWLLVFYIQFLFSNFWRIFENVCCQGIQR